MKAHSLIPIAWFTFVAGLLAQSGDNLNERLRVEHDTNEELPFKLSWWGSPQTYYFILHTEDLTESWSYYDYAIKGIDGAEGLGQAEAIRFDSNPNEGREFFRLFMPTASDPVLLEDFDLDKVLNGPELDTGLDPFSNVDLDLDTIPDDWELFYLQTTKFGENTDSDDDGHLLGAEFQLAYNPTEREADTGPTINMLSGVYENECYVDFINPYSEGVIYYTIDGSVPTTESATFDVIAPDNRTDVQIAFLLPNATLQAIPDGSNALDTGQLLGDSVLTTAESSDVFGWETALTASNFGETTINDGSEDHDFTYVEIPEDNPWTLSLEPAQYSVVLEIINTTGNTFDLSVEGTIYDENDLVASTVPDVYTLTVPLTIRRERYGAGSDTGSKNT
jgi:hypothetical protein